MDGVVGLDDSGRRWCWLSKVGFGRAGSIYLSSALFTDVEVGEPTGFQGSALDCCKNRTLSEDDIDTC